MSSSFCFGELDSLLQVTVLYSICSRESAMETSSFRVIAACVLLLLVCNAFVCVFGQTEVSGLLIEGPNNASAPLGTNASFTCTGNGQIVWNIRGIQARDQSRVNALASSQIYTNFGELNFSTALIFASETNNLTSVECRIEVGNVITGFEFERSELVYLHVYGLPTAPFNLVVSAQDSDIMLTWDLPFSHEGETIFYSIEAMNTGTGELLTLNASGSPFIFDQSIGERNCETYEFTVLSQNLVGLSPTGVFGSEIIPTAPRVIMSSEVTIAVELSGVPSATLEFNTPNPCSTYPVTSYTVSYTAFVQSNETSSASEQRRDIAVVSMSGARDTVLLDSSKGVMADRLYLVDIEACNNAGCTSGQEITFRTSNVQSATVQLDDDYLGTITCSFANGSTVEGCFVVFNLLYSQDNVTFLNSQNITRDPQTNRASTTIQFDVIPDDVILEALVSDLGSEERIVIPAAVTGPFTPTTPPATTMPPPTTPSTTVSTTATVITPPPSILLGDTLYIIIGAGVGAILLLLMLILIIVCVICTVSRKRKSAYIQSDSNGDDLKNNQAYGNIQLTGANATGNGTNNYNPAGLHTQNNPYVRAGEDNREITVSGIGPAYETIDDAKKAAKAAGASLASNPIYASAVPSGSQTRLVDNPVYAESSKQPVQTRVGPGYTDVSALNPVYSGVGSPTVMPAAQPPPQSPGFPYQSVSPVHVPPPSQNGTSSGPSPSHTDSAVPQPSAGTSLNRSQSNDGTVPPHLNPVYEEIRQNNGIRVRNAVSVSSDHEKPPPLSRNESYGLLASSTSPLTTSPPPTSPSPTSPSLTENGTIV